jgi:hypothetical protein
MDSYGILHFHIKSLLFITFTLNMLYKDFWYIKKNLDPKTMLKKS